MAQVAWIGLGNMGSRMAANLIAAGHEVAGFDLSAAAMEQAEAAGLRPAADVRDAVAEADVVFTMLPKGEHVLAVLSEPGGVWESARPGTLIIDSSTSDIESSTRCHEGSAERGFRFVDAPVSGGVSGAADATLAFMVGGRPEDAEEAAAFVTPMAGNVFIAGKPTAGLAAKIANNMMLLICQMASSEGSQLAKHLGLDPRVFWDIVSASSGRSWSQQTWYPVAGVIETAAANADFEARFRADLALKDVNLALAAGREKGLHLEAASLAQEQLQRLADEGLGDKDCTLVVKYVTPGQTQEEI